MTYLVILSPPARRDLNKLPEAVAAAVMEFLYEIAENPKRLGKGLLNELAGLHGAHRGNYRIIYEIFDEEKKVVVLKIQHRSRVYH